MNSVQRYICFFFFVMFVTISGFSKDFQIMCSFECLTQQITSDMPYYTNMFIYWNDVKFSIVYSFHFLIVALFGAQSLYIYLVFRINWSLSNILLHAWTAKNISMNSNICDVSRIKIFDFQWCAYSILYKHITFDALKMVCNVDFTNFVCNNLYRIHIYTYALKYITVHYSGWSTHKMIIIIIGVSMATNGSFYNTVSLWFVIFPCLAFYWK